MDAPMMRSLPQSIEAEQSVIGAMLIDKTAIAKVFEKLEEEDFYRDGHKVIYKAIREMYAKDMAVDLVTLLEHLKSADMLEKAGGVTYISELSASVPTTANLSSYINDDTVGMKDDIKNDFIPDFTKELSQWGENKVYGLPMTKSTEVLYVNKNLLEQLGYTTDDLKDLTFEKLAEISQKAYDELGIAGFGFDSSSNAFISTLKEDGKDFVQMDGKINIQNDWAKKFMQFFREKTQSGAFRVVGEDKFLSGPFSNQKILSYQGSSAGFAHINNNDEFEIVVAEVPHSEGKDKAIIQQGASLFITNNVSAEQQYAAYEFIKFATNTENTAKFATSTGYLPVRKSAQDTDTVKNLLADSTSLYGKIYNVASESLKFAYFTPAINNAQSARSVAEEKYASYVTGTSDDVDAMLKEMNAQVETSISRQ